jgi:hypothetical protein
MRIREIAKATSAGVVVYLVMAACGAHGGTESSIEPSNEAGTMADVGTLGGDAAGNEAGQDTGSLLDAIVNPVKDAKADDTTSGTRLKAKYIVGEDGSRVPNGLYDSQRQEDCFFTAASDGSTRCMPITSDFATVGTYYSDANCTVEVAVRQKCATTPKYVVRYVSVAGSCGQAAAANYSFYAVGVKGSATAVRTKSGTTCSAPIDQSATYDAFAIGAEIPPTVFVKGTAQVAP